MDVNQIQGAERLFNLLGTYKRMQLILQNRDLMPVTIRLEKTLPFVSYIATDDPEGIEMFETMVNQRIAQIEAAIEEL